MKNRLLFYALLLFLASCKGADLAEGDKIYLRLANATPFHMNMVLNFCYKPGNCLIKEVSVPAHKLATVLVPTIHQETSSGLWYFNDPCFVSMSITIPHNPAMPVSINGRTISVRPGVKHTFIEKDMSQCKYKRSSDGVESPFFAIVPVGKIEVVNDVRIPNVRIVKFIQ